MFRDETESSMNKGCLKLISSLLEKSKKGHGMT